MHEPPKILIVDDVSLNVALLEQELEGLGYQTLSARNGQEALERVAATDPDLVLLDLMMPVMDGFQVLTHLRSAPGTRDLPVIVISALDDLASVVRAIQHGAEDHLSKPFEPELLQARISAALAKKRLHDIEYKYRRLLERELEIGQEIQASFLPNHLPRLQGWELDARFFAQRQVAGDLYDAFILPHARRLCLVVGDVTGKGVGAALFMTLFRTLVRVLLLQSDADPQLQDDARVTRCCRLANDYVARTHGEANMCASLFVALVAPETGVVTYVNAGQNPPLVLAPQRIRLKLPPTAAMVGLSVGLDFVSAQVELQYGETLLMYTDGVTEALDAQGQEYGEARLETVAAGAELDAAPLLERIERDMAQYTGGVEPADDITLFAARRIGPLREKESGGG